MSNLSIKDVPEAWAESLRQRAARNHRSLQGELMAIIEQAVQAEPDRSTGLTTQPALPTNNTRKGTVVGYDRRGHPILRFGWKTIEQISAEIAARPPESSPVYSADMPLAVDIIRAERDAR
jgi:plasmid stability protein